MTQILMKQGRSLLGLLAVLAIAVAACGSSSSSKAPDASATPSSQASATTEATAKPTTGGNGGGLVVDDKAFANVTSYKFVMTILSEDITGTLAGLTGVSPDDAMTFQGTVIVKPEPAASLTIGTMRIVEVGGKQYIDLGTGSFIATDMDPGDDSMAESFSPGKMFGSFVGAANATDYDKVGSGEKNDVQADHYQANEKAASQYESLSKIEGATWASDAWIAQDGGYPVSFAVIGTKDGKVVYQISFDVMNVNDPSNNVEAPSSL